MDEADPDDLAAMVAETRLSGEGQAWLMVAHLCASVHNSLLIAANRQGATVGEKDFRDAEDYLPDVWRQPKKTIAKTADVPLDSWMKNMAGF